jgi:hypothetical protein
MYRMRRFIYYVSMVFSKDIFGAIYIEYIKGFVPIRYRGCCLCISPHLILIYLQARVFQHIGFPLTPARLHKSDFGFRLHIYSGRFDNPPGYFLSACGTVFGALCAYGFFGFVETTGVLSVSVSDFVVWDGGLPFSGIS